MEAATPDSSRLSPIIHTYSALASCEEEADSYPYPAVDGSCPLSPSSIDTSSSLEKLIQKLENPKNALLLNQIAYQMGEKASNIIDINGSLSQEALEEAGIDESAAIMLMSSSDIFLMKDAFLKKDTEKALDSLMALTKTSKEIFEAIEILKLSCESFDTILPGFSIALSALMGAKHKVGLLSLSQKIKDAEMNLDDLESYEIEDPFILQVHTLAILSKQKTIKDLKRRFNALFLKFSSKVVSTTQFSLNLALICKAITAVSAVHILSIAAPCLALSILAGIAAIDLHQNPEKYRHQALSFLKKRKIKRREKELEKLEEKVRRLSCGEPEKFFFISKGRMSPTRTGRAYRRLSVEDDAIDYAFEELEEPLDDTQRDLYFLYQELREEDMRYQKVCLYKEFGIEIEEFELIEKKLFRRISAMQKNPASDPALKDYISQRFYHSTHEVEYFSTKQITKSLIFGDNSSKREYIDDHLDSYHEATRDRSLTI